MTSTLTASTLTKGTIREMVDTGYRAQLWALDAEYRLSVSVVHSDHIADHDQLAAIFEYDQPEYQACLTFITCGNNAKREALDVDYMTKRAVIDADYQANIGAALYYDALGA